LVELLVKQERPEAAIGLLEETLQLAPEANTAKAGSIDVVAVQLLLGQVYTEQQRFDEALQAYDNTQKANPSDFRPLVGKGLILQRQGKIEEARAILTTASSLAPAQYKDRVDALIAQLDAPTPADVKVDEQQPAADSTNEADPQPETEADPGTSEPEPAPKPEG
jgi:tetratricopeptide (TPR) repeat protein